MTKICKKAAQDFHRTVSKVFDRVKSVALWSANIRKLAKDHKGYGSAASECIALCLLVGIVKILIFITVDIFKITIVNLISLGVKTVLDRLRTYHRFCFQFF
jgi:hypothetical protein